MVKYNKENNVQIKVYYILNTDKIYLEKDRYIDKPQ